jgi:Concanavalin A-like lectin/glucanases superfamily
MFLTIIGCVARWVTLIGKGWEKCYYSLEIVVRITEEYGKMEKKIVGIMVCVLAIAMIADVAEAQDFASNLVAHWELDEIDGLTAADSVGGFHGTLVGSPDLPTWRSGVVNNAIDFDSANTDDARYVTCPDTDNSALDITGDRSLAAWFRVDDWYGTNWAGLVTKGQNTDGNYNLMQSYYSEGYGGSSNGIAFQIAGQTGTDISSQQVVRGEINVTDGEWHLAVGTYDYSYDDGSGLEVGLLSIYVDGVLDRDYVVRGGETGTNDESIQINGFGNDATKFANSSVDDVRVYNRALTAEDVAYMYSLVNHPPQVDAGSYQSLLWPGSPLAVQLDATVTDDGKPADPCEVTLIWSKLSGPGNVEFDPSPNVEDPCATFTAAGMYELQLSASDSEKDACDVVTIYIRPNDDPIAHWDFETGTDTNVVDRTDNDNYGTFAGDPDPNWVSGWVGDWALDVADGSYVAITADTAADPNLDTMYGEVTVSAWVKVDEWVADSWDGIVTKGSGSVSGDGGWLLMRNSSNDSLAFSTPGAGFVRGSVNVNDTHWHHVVGVHNGTTISLYVDGLLDTSEEASGLVIPKIAQVWINGNSEAEGGLFFDGQIDDVRIFNYGLNDAQVADLADMGTLIPYVDAGDDKTFYMQNGYLKLDATVTDDGEPQAATLVWTWTSEDGTATFDPCNIEDPCVTFSAVGTYVLRLTADDTLKAVYDEVTITVKDPVCDNVIIDKLLTTADLSGPAGKPDCYVNLYDFAAFTGEWLNCNDPQDSECEFPY